MSYKNKEHNIILEFLLVSITCFFFWYLTGLFDGSGFGKDMQRYEMHYSYLSKSLELSSLLDVFSSGFKDPINYLIQNFFKILGFSFYIFLFLVIFSFYKAATYRLNNLLGKRILILQLFTILLYSFYFRIVVLVALRQGIALIVILFCFQTIDEKIGSKKFYKELFLMIFSTLLHASSIIIIPFIFLKKIFKKHIKAFNFLFFSVFIVYSSGLFYKLGFYFNIAAIKDLEYLLRALTLQENDGNVYLVGPTIAKSLSIIVPILIIQITSKYFTNYQKFKLEPIILFYKYISIVTMLLSNLPYHDRILMIGWLFIPIMLSLPFYVTIKNILFPHNYNYKS